MNIPRVKPVILTNRTGHIVDADIFKELFLHVISSESNPPDSFINLELSSDDSIRLLNKKYLGRDEITDVLSFTADIPGVNLIGDIIIDTEVANKQKEDRTFKYELQALFLHGLLHCLGYDHLAAADKKIMDTKEKKYLVILNKEKK